MRFIDTGTGSGWWSGVAVVLALVACSTDEREPPVRSPMDVAPIDIPPPSSASLTLQPDVPPMTEVEPAPEMLEQPPETLPELPSVDSEMPDEGSGCRPALGVSGAPTNISEAIILLNTLPKPTTLQCFLEALDRPLSVYMTKSGQSLQPSPGARSPRTFILRGDMEMSIVFEGLASNTLEFGFRPTPSRSIKTEIEFPVARDVSESTLFDRIQVTARTTRCGACHVAEEHRDFPGFPSGVFESDVFPPFDLDEVSVEDLRAEAANCDASAEAYRCGLLSALYDHGEIVQGHLRGLEE